MHHFSVVVSLFCLVLVQGAVNATRVIQEGCHNTNIILNCTHYLPSGPGSSMSLKWYVDDKTNETRLVGINKDGVQRMYANEKKEKPELMKRLTLHENGLLEISSLQPDDEALYKCVVRPGLKTHLVQLKVACGKVTEIERQVCVEEDVVLECDAKHRSNPRKLKKISWKKVKVLENGSSYARVKSEDGFRVHSNHSLVLPKGRAEGNETFRCLVTKKKPQKIMPDIHLVKAISVKCYEDTPQTPAATVKTTQGRVAMTTASPAKACGGILNNPVGTFQSPNFPSAYPANSHCKWTISLPQDYAAIDVTLNQVNLENEDNCQHDYIAIHDELGNQIGCRICGTHNFPRKIQVKGRVAYFTFHSDSSVNKSGFKIMYKAARTAEKSVL